ncbi:MAG: glutamate racemase [Deinococcales bacterium]
MPNLATKPLGVFDSGVGGLTVVNALRSALPHERLLYLGDTARVPYGSKPLDMVRSFARQISGELLQRGVKGIVIACNTASAASLPALADELPVPVWGVVEPGVAAALAATRGGRVGVLGTVATIGARVYQDRLEAAGASTWGRACPLFVPIVEEGISDSRIATLIAEYYLSDRPALDTVILGCTHYPALKHTLRAVLGEGVTLVDSAESTAAVVAADLHALGLAAPATSTGEVLQLVTGDVDSYLHTAAILGGPPGPCERLSLEALAAASA